MDKEERYRNVFAYFESSMPDADTELVYHNDFELIVAVILSAQCTDKKVNQVTPALFAAYPTPSEMSMASYDELYAMISSITYPQSKAHYLIETSKILLDRFDSSVPSGMDELLSLPGVGRKTANVIRAVSFGIPSMPVDTHVQRVSNRIGLVKTYTPDATEKELLNNIRPEYLIKAHHWLVLHGRYVCKSRSPLCSECGISKFCEYYSLTNK